MDQLYFEEGYLEAGYFTVIREAGANLSGTFTPSFTVAIADTTGYYIPDYIEEGYYALPIQEGAASISAAFSTSAVGTRIQQAAAALDVAVTATATGVRTRDNAAQLAVAATVSASAGRIQQASATFNGVFATTLTVNALKNHTAILDSQFTIAADAVKTTVSDITLANAVNLSLQAAKTTSTSLNASAAFAITAQATKAIEESAALAAAFNQSQVAGFLLSSSANISLRAGVLAIPRLSTERPYNGVNNGLDFVSDAKVFGTHSAVAAFRGEYATFTPHSGRDFLPHAEGFQNQKNGEMAIDFWLLSDASRGVFVIDEPGEGPSTEISVVVNSQKRPALFISSNSTTLNGVTLGNNFEHIRILIKQIDIFEFNIAMYQAGNRVITTSVSNWTPPTNPVLTLGDYYSFGGGARIDEFRILKSPTLFSDNGWSINDTTITVPSAAFTNTEDTKILLHLDNNLLDDTDTLYSVGANLSTSAALTGSISGTQRASAALASAASLSADVNNIQTASSALSTQASVSAVANFTTQASASLQGTGGFAVSAEALVPGDFFAEVSATLSADVERFKGIPATTVSIAATLSADATLLPGARAILSTDAALAATATEISYLNWLPKRSVWHFDNPYQDAITTTGVTTNGLAVLQGTGQSGYGNPIYYTGASESNGGAAYFSGSFGYATIERTTGTYNTNIDTNDFVIDFYVKPYGNTTRYNTLIDFHNSANSFTFGYTYDASQNNQERFNFIIQENGSDAYVYNYVVTTGSNNYFNDYYDPNPLQPKFSGWIYFRIQRISGNLKVFMRDISRDSVTTEIISDTGYTVDFNSGYTIFENTAHSVPTLIDLVALQIASPNYSLSTGGSIPNIQRFYSPQYQIGGELIARASLSTESLLVKFGVLDADVAATVAVSADKIRNVVINASAASTITVDADRISRTSSAVDSAFTQDAVAVKTTDVDLTLSTSANLAVELNRVRLTDAQLSTSASLAAEPKITRTFDAALDCAFTQPDTDYIRYRDVDIATDAIASSLTVAAKVGDFFVNADLQSTLTVTARKTTDTPITLPVVADTNFVVIKAVESEGSIAAEFTASTEGFKIRAAELITSVSTALAADADVIRGGVANLSVAANTSVTYTRVRYNTVGLNTSVTINTAGDRLRLGVVDLEVNSSVLATPFRVQRAEATLTAFVFNVTAGNVIHLDPFRTLLVPQETRYIKVLEERRALIVKEETRVLTV